MAGTRQNNTQAEGLRGLLTAITDLKTTPDANIDWLLGLETAILKKVREPIDQAAAQQAQIMGAAPGLGGGMQSAAGGMPSPIGGGQLPMQQGPMQQSPQTLGMTRSIPPQGLAGLRAMQGGVGRNTPQLPPVDELRRLLSIGN